MEIGEHYLGFAQKSVFARLGLFYLNDHIRLLENILRRRKDFRSGLDILGVLKAAGRPGLRFDQDAMTVLAQQLGADR